MQLISEAEKTNHEDKAKLEEYNKILESNPEHIGILSRRAEVLVNLKMFASALKDCHKVLSFEENNCRGLIYSAACYLAMGEKEKAASALETAEKFNSTDEYFHALSTVREWDTALPESGYETYLNVKETVQKSLEQLDKLIGESMKKDEREWKAKIEAGKKASEKSECRDAKTGKVKKKSWVRCKDGNYRRPDDL